MHTHGIAIPHITQAFSANYDAIDDVCTAIIDVCDNRASADDRFVMRLLLYEALTNAVRHGCAGDATRQVVCETWWDGPMFWASVQDPGPGFDWQAREKKPIRATQCSGHGLQILRRYASHLAFNAEGNHVTFMYQIQGGQDESM